MIFFIVDSVILNAADLPRYVDLKTETVKFFLYIRTFISLHQ